MPRETKESKAVRLIAEQRVRFSSVSPVGCIATVHGDSGDYTTSLKGYWQCTCEHGAMSRSKCSHVLAVEAIYRAVRPAL
jgi:hypothetical protein